MTKIDVDKVRTFAILDPKSKSLKDLDKLDLVGKQFRINYDHEINKNIISV